MVMLTRRRHVPLQTWQCVGMVQLDGEPSGVPDALRQEIVP
jgi:hypothetical protein